MKVLTVDMEECSGCRMCELVCSVAKEGRIQPVLSRIHVVQNFREGLSFPVFCTQCEDAPCMKVCPSSALSRDDTTGAVLLDEDRCIGCRMCTMACPTGAIFFVSEKGRPVKCDLCSGDPICVRFCPTGCLRYEETVRRSLSKRRKRAREIIAHEGSGR
jgi:Fe-S-cluster-containing hydrogenase component 2